MLPVSSNNLICSPIYLNPVSTSINLILYSSAIATARFEDTIVEIKPGIVSLYDKNNTLFIPSPGFGLNKKATIQIMTDKRNLELDNRLRRVFLLNDD